MLSFVCALSMVGTAAFAGTFNVSPTTLDIAPDHHTAVLTLDNQGDHELRFQVTAFAWDESADGEMLLDPTRDLVVFPTLFTVAPGDSRQVRVGTTAAGGDTEAAYRVFVEELPALSADGKAGIQVRTRMGIPVFVEPRAATGGGRIANARIEADSVAFDVVDEGTRHLRLQQVDVVGRDDRGEAVFTDGARGWYVLAGGTRSFAIAVPAEKCREITRFDITARGDAGSFDASVPADPQTCGR